MFRLPARHRQSRPLGATKVHQYQRLVFSLIYHLAGGVQETEDIAQKVFAKVYFLPGQVPAEPAVLPLALPDRDQPVLRRAAVRSISHTGAMPYGRDRWVAGPCQG